jgi:hypothetical protein
MKIDEILSTDPRPETNFSADDLHHLEQIRDLSKAKEFALSLISRPSQKPLSPKKRAWFTASVARAKSTNDLVRMMWSMLMSGEGQPVIGTRHSTTPSYYRSQFGEDAGFMLRAYDMDPMYAMTPDGGTHPLNGKRHDAAALPAGTVVLDSEEHDPGQISYTMFVKTGDGTDLMDESFESKGFLKISPYAKADEVLAAFKEQAKKLLA